MRPSNVLRDNEEGAEISPSALSFGLDQVADIPVAIQRLAAVIPVEDVSPSVLGRRPPGSGLQDIAVRPVDERMDPAHVLDLDVAGTLFRGEVNPEDAGVVVAFDPVLEGFGDDVEEGGDFVAGCEDFVHGVLLCVAGVFLSTTLQYTRKRSCQERSTVLLDFREEQFQHSVQL